MTDTVTTAGACSQEYSVRQVFLVVHHRSRLSGVTVTVTALISPMKSIATQAVRLLQLQWVSALNWT